ncbi:MAG TPA: ABC transporter substrate-binding protein [Trueperaceae bacterium]|nr:ABC transporter substrate-binding protein [Trueperaceae bacterium]
MTRISKSVKPIAFLVFALFLTAVSAQGFLEGEVRIGVILPPAQTSTSSPAGDELAVAVARAAAQGAAMAADEFTFNAEMLGIDFALETTEAAGADGVTQAAANLLAEHGVFGVVGGFDAEEATALATWSAETGIPFINVGSSNDELRNGLCQPTMFHVEPSAAMYLDAMAGWYVRSGLRTWYFVRGSDEESTAQWQRILAGLRERHFGARSVGDAVVETDTDLAVVARNIGRAGADLVVMLLPAVDQLTVLAGLEAGGVDAMVTGFPYPEAETRTFYAASRAAAPVLGTGHRISSWEATLDAYGARELNARYRATYGDPMDASAWAVYQGVKMLYDSAFFGGSHDPADVVAYLGSDQAVFDVWKGIGTTFRPWDGQLRQSLYLSKIDASIEDRFTLASLVGELPAIYMPGTEPVERLDQIGDMAAASSCTR